MAQLVKNLSAMWETWVRSLGWEDPLGKGTATHSSMLTWRIPWTVQFMGLQRVGHRQATFTCFVIWSGLGPSIEKWVRVFKKWFYPAYNRGSMCLSLSVSVASPTLATFIMSFQTWTVSPSPIFSPCLVFLPPQALASFTQIWASCEPVTFLTLNIYHFPCSGVKCVSWPSSYPG